MGKKKRTFRDIMVPFLKKWKIVDIALGVIDVFAITLAFQIAYYLNISKGIEPFTKNYLFTNYFVLFLIIWLIILIIIKITKIPRTKRYSELFFEYLQSAIVILILQFIAFYIIKIEQLNLNFIIQFSFLGFGFLFTARLIEYRIFKEYRAKGFNYINIILIADETSITLIDKLINHKEWGYRVLLIFSDSKIIKETYINKIKVLPERAIVALHDLMEVDMIDEVLNVKEKTSQDEIKIAINSCEEIGVVFRLLYNIPKLVLTNASITKIAEQNFLTFSNIPNNSFGLAIKKFMDVYISIVMIILLAPVMSVIALIIKLDSKGPVLFKQVRVGLRGRQFYLYKFRTMIVNADKMLEKLQDQNEMDGPTFKIKNDPRITKIGGFLRKTGLDELPQLFNILKGEMSLIGPRPPLLVETKQYKRWQLRRLSVRPGLSCFWQIKDERNSIEFEKWMELDLNYIDSWSPRLDLIILLKTIRTVFKRTGA